MARDVAIAVEPARILLRPSGALRVFVSRLRRSKVGMVGFVMFASVLLVALLAPVLAPYDPREIVLERRFLPPVFAGGRPAHLLGTDQLGRDILSQLLYGARISMTISLLSVSGAFLIGISVGAMAGYFGGFVDVFFMRWVDIMQSLPSLVVLLALIAVLGPKLLTIIVVFSFTWWGGYARVVRGEVLSVKQKEFVEAARALGLREWRIMIRHVLPNVISSAMALAALSLGSVIIAESALSYLGISADVISWGRMLAAGREYVVTAWWLALLPGMAIVYTVLGVVFFGDWVRDYVDPRLRGRL
ncbi:MAG: ABC transporter permease [Armatimonadota bacterium]|nr:ABC transporter permease [Armatimonadota bacterium]MDR7488505.1 ABC transporter permease [Armatimonadota bacterium]MDR7573804.1 ABC transporter permease [Armatimonadota bacterium]